MLNNDDLNRVWLKINRVHKIKQILKHIIDKQI